MKFKNIKIRELITALLVSFLYPVARAVTSKNPLVAFSDSTFIIGLLGILFGVFTASVLHGDYDLTSYLAHRKKLQNNEIDFATYEAEQKEKRKDSFNYPLFIGILFLILSFITAKLA